MVLISDSIKEFSEEGSGDVINTGQKSLPIRPSCCFLSVSAKVTDPDDLVDRISRVVKEECIKYSEDNPSLEFHYFDQHRGIVYKCKGGRCEEIPASELTQRITSCIQHFNDDGETDVIKHKYDWAWIKYALDSGYVALPPCVPLFKNMANRDYIAFLQSIDAPNCPSVESHHSTIGSRINKALLGKKDSDFPWVYDDINAPQERDRRNAIVQKFKELIEL